VVSAESGFKSLKDMLDVLRKDPPKYSYATGGVGSAAHIAAAMFVRLAGVPKVVHVPYKTTAFIFPDLIANRVAFGLYSPDSVASYVKSGRLRALMFAGPKRLKSMPDVPTAAEVGLPDMHASSWYVMQAPAGVPDAIVNRLSKEMMAILKEPDSLARFERAESTPLLDYTPERTAAFVEAERKRWEPHVRASGATVD
jgi:tripartite-type tricarboxylate transporter receptor subunit TctC